MTVRTTDRAQNPQTRRRLRAQSELRCRQSLLRLICVTSMLRTAVTRVAPLAGSAAWWITPLCTLPGLMLYLAFSLMMRATGTQSLPALAGKVTGKAGEIITRCLAALLLLSEALVCAAMLTRMFTEGFGVEGTRLTITLLALVPMLLCLDATGLSRAVFLLRRMMLVVLAITALNWAEAGQGRGFFPVQGDGSQTAAAALRIGFSMGWPPCLLLFDEPAASSGGARWKDAFWPLLLCWAVTALFIQAVPNDLLHARSGLVKALLSMTAYLHAPVRMAMYILLMTSLFLTAAGTITLASEQTNRCLRKGWGRSACVLTILVFAIQLSNAGVLTDGFGTALSLRLWPLTVCAAALLIASFIHVLRGKEDS